MVKERIKNRANYLDLVVKTEIGYINIEVANNTYNKDIAYRNFIYLMNLATNVAKEGIKVKKLPNIYQINLIFGQANKKYKTARYKMYSQEAKEILTRKFEIININVDKYKEMYYNDINKRLTNKYPIIAFTMTKEELEKEKDESKVFETVLNGLNEINDENIVPVLMPIEEENKWYEEMVAENAKKEGYALGTQNGINQGISQGAKQNKIETVINMLKEKFDFKIISKITGLTKKEIENISKTMNY